jgi:hypothetical protein
MLIKLSLPANWINSTSKTTSAAVLSIILSRPTSVQKIERNNSLREIHDIPSNAPILVYQGMVIEGRGIVRRLEHKNTYPKPIL